MADFNSLLTTYQSLVDKAGKERDPEHRKWLEQQANANLEMMRTIPEHERGEGAGGPAPKSTLKDFASTLELPGAAVPKPGGAEAPKPTPSYPEFDAGRDAYFKREAAAMGKPLAPELLSSKPGVASATPDVAAEVQPSAAPTAAPQGTQPLTFDEYRRLGGSGGGPGRVQITGASANAGAAGAASDAANAAERKAILDRAGQQQSDGTKLGETMAAFASQMKASDEEHQTYLMQARERVSGLINESKQAAEEFRAATREQGFMQSLSSGGRVGAAISLALGALGGGLTGQGGNAALDVLKFRVDEDLRSRALNINAKGQALDAVDGLLQRNLQIFGDEVSAREATRASIFDSLKLEVQRQAAISGGADAMGAAQQLVAGMDAEKARAEEVLANQQLQAMLKAARAGGGQNLQKQLAAYQQYLKNDVGIQTDATKLAALQGAGGKPDIYSEEGKRASDRIARLYEKVKPADAAVETGKLLLEKVGVPSVTTRARADIDTFFKENSGFITSAGGLALTPLRTLTAEENAQMSALMNFTINQQKALDPRISNADLEIAVSRLIRQSWNVSQEALTAQIRQQVGEAERYRKDALATDPEAAVEYEREQSKRRSELKPSAGGGRGIPDYGRSF